STLRSDRDNDISSTRSQIRPARMCQQASARQTNSHHERGPARHRLDAHEEVASALLARLDDVALQFLQLRVARMHDAASGLQRDERGRAQLGQLLDEELGAVTLRQRSGHLQPEAVFALRRLDAGDVERHIALRHGGYLRGILAAIAVEQTYLIAGPE